MEALRAYFSVIYSPFDDEEITIEDIEDIAGYEGLMLVPLTTKFIKKTLGKRADDCEGSEILGYLCHGDEKRKARIPKIFYNDDLPEMEKFFILAHEVGHKLLHERITTPPPEVDLEEDKDKFKLFTGLMELEANLFSTHVLIADKLLRLKFGKKLKNSLLGLSGESTKDVESQIYGFCREYTINKLKKGRKQGSEKLSEMAEINLKLRVLTFRQEMEKELEILYLLQEKLELLSEPLKEKVIKLSNRLEDIKGSLPSKHEIYEVYNIYIARASLCLSNNI